MLEIEFLEHYKKEGLKGSLIRDLINSPFIGKRKPYSCNEEYGLFLSP